MYKMAFTISRRGRFSGRPPRRPDRIGGNRGATKTH
jgi:hypothetical protein